MRADFASTATQFAGFAGAYRSDGAEVAHTFAVIDVAPTRDPLVRAATTHRWRRDVAMGPAACAVPLGAVGRHP